MNFIARQLENERRLSEYIDFLHMLICKRCWRAVHKLGKPYHHRGGFIHLISQIKIDESVFLAWLRDQEHGLLHGLHVGFFAYATRSEQEKKEIKEQVLVNYSPFTVAQTKQKPKNCHDSDLSAEAAFIGYLFHDLLKCQGKPSEHDEELKQVIPFLGDEVYRHSKPQVITDPIIVADRIELMRFADFPEWRDPKKCRIGQELYGDELLKHYYRHIRPCVEKLLADLDSVWFSHVMEAKNGRGHNHYPVGSWLPMDSGLEHKATPDNKDAFSVNHGRLPVEGNCHVHTANAQRNLGLPSIMGMISNRNVREFATIEPAPPSCWGRDHLFLKIKQPIPWSNWLFIYDNINDLDLIEKEQCCCLSRTLLNRLVVVTRQMIDLLQITTVLH